MTLQQLINQLQAIQSEVGGEVEVMHLGSEYIGNIYRAVYIPNYVVNKRIVALTTCDDYGLRDVLYNPKYFDEQQTKSV
jgi:hypothetical protein